MVRSNISFDRDGQEFVLSGELLEHLPVATVQLDSLRKVRYANAAFRVLAQVAPSESFQCSFENLLDEEYRLLFLAFAGQLEDCSSIKPLECRLAPEFGADRWILISATADPACHDVWLQCTDISALKTAEKDSQQRVDRLALAIEAAGQGIWDVDVINGTATYSDTWRLIRGYSPGDDVDAIAGSWFDRLHPDDVDRVREITQGQNDGQIPSNILEYRERHNDGHWIWILSRGRPVEWLPSGQVARVVGTDTDITQLKSIEVALETEKERLSVTLGSIAEGVISIDVGGRVSLINSSAVKILELSDKDVAIGKEASAVLQLRSQDGNPLTADLVMRCQRTNESHSVHDAIYVTPNGKQRYLRCSFAPIATETANVLGVVAIFDDTTDEYLKTQALAHSALHDPLTGLQNRTAFNHKLGTAFDAAQNGVLQSVLCYIDLDGFKSINDGAGHAAGDHALKEVANLLRSACRQSDIAARLGGDEFALLLTDCTLKRAREICLRIAGQMASRSQVFKGQDYALGASIGLCPVEKVSVSIEAIMEDADNACYQAKAAGKSCVAYIENDAWQYAFS